MAESNQHEQRADQIEDDWDARTLALDQKAAELAALQATGDESSGVLQELAERLRVARLRESAEPVRLEPGLTLAGTTIQILKELGSGGMGAIYLAHDEHEQRDVVVKTALWRSGISPEARAEREALFLREMDMLQRLDGHPGIAPIYRSGKHKDPISERSALYFVMPHYAEAPELDAWVMDRWATLYQHNPARVLELFTTLCQGLAQAHGKGVLHRDIKPANILVPYGTPVLIDFGLAEVWRPEREVRFTGGTGGYRAPELESEGKFSQQTDLFALGVTLVRALTGWSAEMVRAGSQAGWVGQIESRLSERLRQSADEWRNQLTAILGECLAKNPAHRTSSVSALQSALADLADLWRRRARKRTPTLTFGLRDRKPTYEPRHALGTGRDILEVLHEGFAQSPRQLLHGLKGMGKTETAVTYAHQYKQSYPVRLWIDASSRDSLLKGFQDLAQQLESDFQHDKDQNLMVRGVLQTLADPERIAPWLAVFDNIEKPDDLDGFLPAADYGKVLLTSYLTDLRPLEIPREARQKVEKFPPEAARHFLLRRSGHAGRPLVGREAQALQEILEELDGLPLALELAGAWLADNPTCSLADYFASYRSSRSVANQLFAEALNQKLYPHTVATTWLMNFAAVERENPASAVALQLCALLEAEDIPLELFQQGHPHLGERIATALADVGTVPTRLHALLRPLQKYSLMSLSEDRLSFGHRQVQAVVLDGLDQPARLAWLERLIAALNNFLPNPEPSNWPQWRRWIKHVVRLLDHAADAKYEPLPLAVLLNKSALLLHATGRYGEAEPLYRRALVIREQALGPAHPDVASSLNNLAELLRATGRSGEAEPLYRRALEILEQALGPAHPDVATSLNNLAALLRATGRYGEAEPLYRRALVIREQALGPAHPDVASSLNNLAELLRATGRSGEAEPLYRRALEILEQALGPAHPDEATSLNNLAALLLATGRYGEAEPLYRRALGIFGKVLGQTHPHTQTVFENLRTFYRKQGEVEKLRALEREFGA